MHVLATRIAPSPLGSNSPNLHGRRICTTSETETSPQRIQPCLIRAAEPSFRHQARHTSPGQLTVRARRVSSPRKAPSPHVIQLGPQRDPAYRPLGDEPRWSSRRQTAQNLKELLREFQQPQDLADPICAGSLPAGQCGPVDRFAMLEQAFPPLRLLQKLHYGRNVEHQWL